MSNSKSVFFLAHLLTTNSQFSTSSFFNMQLQLLQHTCLPACFEAAKKKDFMLKTKPNLSTFAGTGSGLH